VPAPVQSRLRLFQKWDHDLPLKFLWALDFSNANGQPSMGDVGNNIKSWLQEVEQNNWRVYPTLMDQQTDSRSGVGYLLAQQVAFPNESFGVSTLPVNRSGGFVAGYVGDRRSDYGSSNKVDISFLETNTDIIDFFIKPWIVAASYKGLIEDDDRPIKCNITATLYSRAIDYYNNKWFSSQDSTRRTVEYTARKQVRFKDCVPVNVEGDQISYGELSFDELIKTVSFVFSHYEISHGFFNNDL
tara:strand:+ start:117 stop:845 length:729 start_codon:yes stop_codon:yes gene_type:complete